MEDLKRRIETWNGVHMDHLKSIYEDYRSQASFFDLMISWSSTPGIQAATTWLIKHYYDSGFELNKDQLHVLQILPHLEIETDQLILLDKFVRRCLKSNNKFVRAWAYQGLYQLYEKSAVSLSEIRSLCEMAMETESASIKSKAQVSEAKT